MTDETSPAIAVQVSGEGEPLLLIHGFMGSAGTWQYVLPVLERRHLCIALDLPGHGGSPALPSAGGYTMDAIAASLIAILDRHEVPRCSLLGYSLGGRIALYFALRHSERVGSLILESANPGIDDLGDRASRVDSDNQMATMIENQGIVAFVDHWERTALFASQERLPQDRRSDIRRTRLGTDPMSAAAFVRLLSPGRLPSLWASLPAVTAPTLLVAGADDVKYVHIATRMHEVIKDSVLSIIPNSGHSTHVERPAEFARACLQFLTTNGS